MTTTAIVTLLLLCFHQSVGTSKPNIIIMLMDDMGWGDLTANGNPENDTPNLDKMAAEGIIMKEFYAANPVCSPTRAALLTGRLPIRTGFYSTFKQASNAVAFQNVTGGIPEKEILLPELLRTVGYKSKVIGKWHLGHQPQYLPLQHGFDEFFGSSNCHLGPYDNKEIPNIPVFKDSKMIGRYFEEFPINIETGESNITQLLIEEAEEFMESQHQKGNPFFLYWAADATHTPLYASKKFLGRSPRGLYGDAVRELDSGVGRILTKLTDLKIEKNTVVFFSSDNGGATYAREQGGSNGPLLCGKLTTMEGGMREPTIIFAPGRVDPEQISSQVGTVMDFFVTSLDLAGVKVPSDRPIDGSSLLPLMLNKTNNPNNIVYYYRGNTLMAVRSGWYKAHFWTFSGNSLSAMGVTLFSPCPGQNVTNITTPTLVDHRKEPILIHLGRDFGEKYPISPTSNEYLHIMPLLNKIANDHLKTLVPGDPQFDQCDNAIQNWAPPGCQEIGKCLKAPSSHPYRCVWEL